ncbi:MAG: helix-turn-helix transcriptional regulator [Methanobrevibacter sp.]|uniref:helix-turn-helix domain-containing protein n=1 Tax=Methanobrevibacter sp. TaxID=66852 RepID=UPI0025EF9DF9|nr:helix-turn-helix transcriptional regulator [Methanobrevibacter sp.]MBR0270413.1 helix-turn-helix transcriptional regulator [Methanobrevibacter sp.]
MDKNITCIRLKKLRKLHNFTQKQLADYLEIDQSNFSKIENGKRTLNLTLANKICNLYACSHEYLLGISDDYDVENIIVVENNSNMDLNAIAKVNEVMMHLNLLNELDSGVYDGQIDTN